jgi:hypothetical protein
MRNRIGSFIVLFAAAAIFSSPAMAQFYYPDGKPTDAQKAAATASAAKLTYDPHDLSGVWRGAGGPRDPNAPKQTDPRIGDAFTSPLLGGAPAPPLTPAGQKEFDARKPSAAEAWQSRRVAPALGNDPLGNCDPLGYPRSLGRGPVEFIQTPTKILEIFDGVGDGMRYREIWTDGRTLPPDLDPRWYGWNLGHWEGNNLIVDSTNYDDRSWLDGNGWPHSEDMKLHEVYSHPDLMTLEITMTINDPATYTKPWVGNKQTFKLALPKGSTILYEEYCVPSEEQSFNFGVRNPAGGDLKNSRPLK